MEIKTTRPITIIIKSHIFTVRKINGTPVRKPVSLNTFINESLRFRLLFNLPNKICKGAMFIGFPKIMRILRGMLMKEVNQVNDADYFIFCK